MAILKRFEIWLLLGLMIGALVFALKTEPPVDPELDETAEEPPTAAPVKIAKVTSDSAPTPVTKTDNKNVVINEKTKEVKSEPEPSFQIQKVKATPTQQGMVVDLTLLGQAEGEDPVDFNVDTDAISVMTDSGDKVERFFLPFPEPAVMDAREKSIINLKYWLKNKDTKVLWVKLFDHKLKAEIPE